MNRKERFLNELDGKGKVFSALFGALTLFAVLGKIVPGWYGQMPLYTEWICGDTTWSAYNKQADMNIVQSALFGLPLLFCVFAVLYVVWNRTMKKAQKAGYVFATTYIALLTMLFRGSENAPAWLALWLCLFVGYWIAGASERSHLFGRNVILTILFMLSVIAGILFLNAWFPRFGSLWERLDTVVIVLSMGLFFGLILVKKIDAKAEVLYELQFVLPFSWLSMYAFRYRYEKDGSLLELFGSGRWKWMCILFCVLCLILCLAERVKKGRRLYLSTFIMTAVIRVFSQPEGILNVDYFHNGEISMPMQQLVSYGKLPYKDLIPIHGMCDYYYGLVNTLFFDGTYLSLNAAKVVGDLLMAVLFAVVLYVFIENKLQSFCIVYFFLPFLISKAGMRYWVMFFLFFALFSPQIKKGMQSLYVWIFLSIAAIAWNASIGGAAALAFLPVILYRLWRDFPSQWKELKKCPDRKKKALVWGAWELLILCGIAFIPLFLQIVGYLKENTGTTLYVNGMAMFSEVSEAAEYMIPGIAGAQGEFFFQAFAFLIPMFVAFVLMFRKQKTGAGEMFVTYLAAFTVLANYSFVRYDEGLRAGVLGIFFMLLTSVTLLYRVQVKENESSNRTIMLYSAMLAGAVLLFGNTPFVTSENLVLEKDVPAQTQIQIMGQEIEDPVVHVSGELVSMPGLGTGFIQGNTLLSLQNVNTLVQAANANGQTVFDITNAVANAVTLDMPLYLPYSSAYNISNEVMQNAAISRLEENLPDIILAAPEIRFDDAPFSLRCIHLYSYLMQKDYVPYKYENVIYLVRGENPLPQAEQSTEAFAQLMHKKDLAYLPAVWGENAENMSQSLTEINVGYQIEMTETGLRVVFDEPISGREIAMIGIAGPAEDAPVLQKSESSECVSVVMTIPSSIATLGEAEFEFAYAGAQMLIPVCSSPYFMWQEQIEYLEFETDGLADIESVKFYKW